MRKRRIYVLIFVCAAVAIAAGLRTTTGQGYSNPIVSPGEGNADGAVPARTLEVWLTNRRTGRPQHHRWSLSMPSHGSLEIECHEWTFVSCFGLNLFGFPSNSFRRIVPIDLDSEGIAEPYHFKIQWRQMTNQPAPTTPGSPVPSLRI